MEGWGVGRDWGMGTGEYIYMSKLIYRVTRKLEQAPVRHTHSKSPRFGVHFIDAPPHGSGRVPLPIETYHRKIASKYSSEMGRHFSIKIM